MKTHIQLIIQNSIHIKEDLMASAAHVHAIETLTQQCIKVLNTNGKIILAGNGGSFADAQHIAAEFVSRFLFDRPALASIALGCNSSTLSAIGNDYGYESSFSRELAALAQPNDIFIPISTSGNSPNILEAVKVAQDKKMTICGLTGKTGGALAKACTCIQVPSDETPRIQECHILIGHIICELVEKTLFKKN